jgi:gliding motility-associated-like protein
MITFLYTSDFPGIDPFFEMEVYEIDIFNRWGQLVFSSERDGDKKWDGRISGRIAAEGVYYYVLKYKRKCWDDQVEVLKGYVTLIR